MSRHWKPQRRFQQARRRNRRRGFAGLRFGVGEIRLVLLGGVLAGLVYAAAAPEPSSDLDTWREIAAPDPWAESRRSSEILKEQEGAPEEEGRTGAALASGAVRIVDGDTFWLGGEKIRIADIDTPEVRGRCPYEIELAARATRRMEALLNEGAFELQPVDRDEDRYGRKLRIVTRGGRSLGDTLVAEGLARPYAGGRRPWCA